LFSSSSPKSTISVISIVLSEKLTKVGATIEAKIIRENKKVIIVLLMDFIKKQRYKVGYGFF